MNKPPRARVAAELTVTTREGLSTEPTEALVLVYLLGECLIAALYVMYLLRAQPPRPLYGPLEARTSVEPPTIR